MQKSYQGLLQSLCYDIFAAYPGLLPQVCGAKWESLTAAESLRAFFDGKDTMWHEIEMVQLIRRIVELSSQVGGQNIRLCLFIDGLDEYHGEHDQLVEAISTLAGFTNVKIVVSSRPWNVFMEAFGDLQQTKCLLVLQHLTMYCIAAYARDRLEHNKRSQRLMRTDPRCVDLVSEITTRADGVFLWVFLVVNELMKGLTNHDDIATLQRQLRQIPQGLVPYFKYMFENLDAFYRSETAAILQVVLTSAKPLDLHAFAVIFTTEPLAARLLHVESTVLTTSESSDLKEIFEARIKGCCGDLLEVRNGKVQFLHLTVRDFLATDDMRIEVAQRSDKDFDVNFTLCKMLLLNIRYDVLPHLPANSEGMQSPALPDCESDAIPAPTHTSIPNMVEIQLQKPQIRSSFLQLTEIPFENGDDDWNWITSSPEPMDSTEGPILKTAYSTRIELICAFYAHSRAFEDEHGRPVAELYNALKAASGTTPLTKLDLHIEYELELLAAWMHVPLQLKDMLKATGSITSKTKATEYAMEALKYLVLPEAKTHMEHWWDFHEMHICALALDPDRRGFRLDTITFLLMHGADSTKLWYLTLMKLQGHSIIPGYRKTMLFKLLTELKRAGARCEAGDQALLEHIFGYIDAEWLLSRPQTLDGLPRSEKVPQEKRPIQKYNRDLRVRSLSSLRRRRSKILTSSMKWFGS